MARSYAESLGVPFIETSAKTANNIEAAFLQVTMDLIKSRSIISLSTAAKVLILFIYFVLSYLDTMHIPLITH
jgi:hypothetical protein